MRELHLFCAVFLRLARRIAHGATIRACTHPIRSAQAKNINIRYTRRNENTELSFNEHVALRQVGFGLTKAYTRYQVRAIRGISSGMKSSPDCLLVVARDGCIRAYRVRGFMSSRRRTFTRSSGGLGRPPCSLLWTRRRSSRTCERYDGRWARCFRCYWQ